MSAPLPPPPPNFDAPPPPPHAHIPVAKGGASLSELLAKRLKRNIGDDEESNEPVWSIASSQYLQQKSKTGFVGLSNQGATCYLNSLLQTLYLTPELRYALYNWTYDPALDGPEESCIPLQLQKLFVRLQLGSSAIIDTKDLTTSFGWVGNQAFQQHDVQELLRKLFEALDICFTRGATAIRSKSSQLPTPMLDAPQNLAGLQTAGIINDLYEGTLTDYIRCMECGHSRERQDVFFDIPVAIRDVESLEEGLEKYLAPEILTEDNRWSCDVCETKVDAFKGLQLFKLPYFLTLQLKRFDYDYETWRRIKLNNKVSFPMKLNMNQFYSESNAQQWEYELFSVMIHSGGAEGGHYFAFVKSFETGKWFKFNDASVTEISDEDICTVFGGANPLNKPNNTQSDGESKTETSDVPKAPPKQTLHSSYSTNAYMLLYRLIDPNRNLATVASDLVPADLREWIQKENLEFDRLKAEHQKRLDNVSLTVFYEKTLNPKEEEGKHESEQKPVKAPTATDNMANFTVNVDKHETLEHAMNLVYSTAQSRGLHLISASCIRLRPFSPPTGTKSPSWLDSELQMTLEQLNFSHQKNIYMETKEENTDWENDETFWTLGVIKYIHPSSSFSAPVSVRVPWRATFSDLKKIVRDHPELKWDGEYDIKTYYDSLSDEQTETDSNQENLPEPNLRVFATDSSANCRELKGESSILNQTLQLNDGQCVHIEYLPLNKPSLVAAKFEEERHKVQIFYNRLESSSFDDHILIDTRKTLRSLKDQIAKELQLDPQEFKMCRNLLSKEFNNLDITIAAANLYEGSAVCIVKGRPIGVNQIKLNISILKAVTEDDEIFTAPWTLMVDQDISVEELRMLLQTSPQLTEHIQSSATLNESQEGKPSELQVPKFIRLREKKANRCGAVIFDGDTLKNSMDNLMDGDDVIIQLLDNEDNLRRDQVLLTVRRWIPSERKLDPKSFEIIVERTATIRKFKLKLSEMLEASEGSLGAAIPSQFIAVSKPYLFMIKKKDASALSGLNWEVSDEVMLTQSPWYLGDGDFLLFKDARDPEHGPVEISSAGSGSSVRPQAREQFLKIHTIYDEETSENASKDSNHQEKASEN